jgi:hypothetical protein
MPVFHLWVKDELHQSADRFNFRRPILLFVSVCSVEVKIIRPETDNLVIGKEHIVRDVEHFPYNYDNLG